MKKQIFTTTQMEGRLEHYVSIFTDPSFDIAQLLWDFRRTDAVSWVQMTMGYQDLDCDPSACNCEGHSIDTDARAQLRHPWPVNISPFSDEEIEVNTPILESIWWFLRGIYRGPRRKEHWELAQSLSHKED
jgi:hypothetical protein